MSGFLKIVVGSVLVVGLGVGVWLGAPLFYDSRVDEALPDGVSNSSLEGQTLLRGSFEGADSFHRGSGGMRVVETGGKRYVLFEGDFSVTNGPDLFVYLGRDGAIDEEVNLGRLKGSKGAQHYEIPDAVSLDEYDEVHVWCRAFATPFSKAGW